MHNNGYGNTLPRIARSGLGNSNTSSGVRGGNLFVNNNNSGGYGMYMGGGGMGMYINEPQINPF